MASNKKNALALSLLAPLFLVACNSLPVNSHNDSNDLGNSGNILNLLDPDIRTEEQAFAKGQAALQEGKPENALFYFVKTLQFNKNNVRALENIASIHERGKHPEIAIKVYQDILAVDGNHALANEKLGLYYLDKGQDGKAKSNLSQAVKYDKKRWKSYNGLGVIADLERNTDEAINYYQSALEIMPNSPMLLNNLGYSYYLSGDELKARGLFNQALNFDTQYKRAIHNLALIEIKNGEFTSAAMLFNRIMSPHESYNNIGYIALLNGQYEIAEEYLIRAIDECPVYFPKAQQNLKNLLAAKGSNMPYQATPDELQQIAPAPEIQSDIPPEPSVSVKPKQNTTRVVQAEKPAPQKIKSITFKSTDKKVAKDKMTKAQQIAAQPVKKKTQPEIKQITDSKAALSDAAKPVDISDRAPPPVPPKPSTASAHAEAKPADQDQKTAEPNLVQTPSKSEESKTETAQSPQPTQPQAVENKQPDAIAEHPTFLPQPVASPVPERSVQPSPALGMEEQKKAMEASKSDSIALPAAPVKPAVIAEHPISPPQPVASPSPGESTQPSPELRGEEQMKVTETPKPDSISPSATSVKPALSKPDQQQQSITDGKQPALENLHAVNTGHPTAFPESKLNPPFSLSPQAPLKKQEVEIPKKLETQAPLTPVNSLKKNDVFVTDIAEDK
jgi:Flp pilus assembly protein TadD